MQQWSEWDQNNKWAFTTGFRNIDTMRIYKFVSFILMDSCHKIWSPASPDKTRPKLFWVRRRPELWPGTSPPNDRANPYKTLVAMMVSRTLEPKNRCSTLQSQNCDIRCVAWYQDLSTPNNSPDSLELCSWFQSILFWVKHVCILNDESLVQWRRYQRIIVIGEASSYYNGSATSRVWKSSYNSAYTVLQFQW